MKKNKIKINIISGDSEEYLRYILQKIDFDNYKIANLNKLDNNEIKKIIMDDYNVFSRATPDQKKIIIEELKTNNKVAMIGDGINDLLALKTADCSISMPNGHDITKKISNFVLLNSNFKNLIFLIEESKTVIKNIQSMYSLFFTKMMSMILLSFFYIFISLFFGNFFPLNINNLFPWEIITSGIGTVLISFDKFVENKKIDINNFIFNILKYSILSAFLQILIFFSSFLIHLFMPNILTFKGFISLSVLMISFSSIFIMYFLCYQPLNKTRFFILFFLTFLMSFFFIVDYFIFKKNNFSIIDIFYNEINLKSFLILFVIVLFLFFIYSLFVKYLKKKESFNRNKK